MKTEHKSTFLVVLIILILAILSIFLNCEANAQKWQDENRGLYPQSLQLTINVPNEMVGIIYGYLFQKPVLSMPIGVYGEFVNTIPQNWHSYNYYKYNNYDWQRKYALGAIISLPHALKSSHFMATIGIVYNQHPGDEGRPPGQYTGGIEHTTDIGFDIGVRIQINHFTSHIKSDIINWMRYTQIGAGFTF